ncbi:hypothetical protein CYY_006675 [Polysphondylium violaceum]|uniref:UDENN domain-containing protein n=1 Tax=Polysphondylium violaceum TaxID=133409 RepID=A0A8J4PQ90_9MYCE|nr:hypothetical protein CYY_006675 [Polysphondylium violaceum]
MENTVIDNNTTASTTIDKDDNNNINNNVEKQQQIIHGLDGSTGSNSDGIDNNNNNSNSNILINIIPPSPPLKIALNKGSSEIPIPTQNLSSDDSNSGDDISTPRSSIVQDYSSNNSIAATISTSSSSSLSSSSTVSTTTTPTTTTTTTTPTSIKHKQIENTRILTASVSASNTPRGELIDNSCGNLVKTNSFPSTPSKLSSSVSSQSLFTDLDRKLSVSKSTPNVGALLSSSSPNTPIMSSRNHQHGGVMGGGGLVNELESLTLGSYAEASGGIEDNTSGTLVGGITSAREGKIFDHFLVVGLPSTAKLYSSRHDERQTHKPQIIYQYPQNQTLPNDMIEQFCFPTGIESRSSQRSYSSSSLNQVSFCNLSHLSNPSHSFVFLLTTQNTLYYGICIIKEEEVSTLPSFINEESPLNQYIPTPENSPNSKQTSDEEDLEENSAKAKRRSFNRNQFDFIAPRVYCLLTRFPFFQLHFQMLHSILESERMCMLFSMSGQSQDPNATSTLDILNLYHSISMESVKDKVQFKVPTHDYKTDYHCPVGSEDRLIADWSFYTTFQSMSIEDILKVYSWVLLERQVFIISKQMGNISSFVFSFISLLKPFVWQCCFIPVLPDSLLESIDAPFPFIIGHNQFPDYILHLKRDYLIVDIDNKKLIYPESILPPSLPGKKKLLNTLTVHRKELLDLQNQIPIDHLKHRFTQNIINTFREYQEWLVDQISTGVITCINNMYIQQQQQFYQLQVAQQQQQLLLQQQQVDLNKSNSSINNNNEEVVENNDDDQENGSNENNDIVNSNNNEEDNNSDNNNNNSIELNKSTNSGNGKLSSSTNHSPSPSTSPPSQSNLTSITSPPIPPPITSIDPLTSIELLNRQSIHFLEDQKNINGVIECLNEKYKNFFRVFLHTQMFNVNVVKIMLSIQEKHKTSIGLIEKLESLICMEEKSKEVLMEYQKMAKKDGVTGNGSKVDMNTIKKQLKDSEGVINELRESKKKLELEALATSPSKNNLSFSSLLGLSSISELRKKKLEFGHRRSRSVTDQVEQTIFKKLGGSSLKK